MARSFVLAVLFCGTHVVALLVGTLSGLLYNAFNSTTSGLRDSASQPKMFKTHARGGRYDVLPLLVLEHDIAPQDLRIVITEAQTRILFNATHLDTGPMYIYYPAQREYVGEYLRKATKDLQKVLIRSVPDTENRQQALLSVALWSDLASITDKVLSVDISSVLCSNPTHTVSYFVAQDYAWIGAAWEWASDPDHSNHLGGNGALSLRSTRHLAQVLRDKEHDQGNEDMWFTSALREWYEEGQARNGVPPPKLPSQPEQQLFAVEVVPSPDGTTPVGIYHLMVAMDQGERDRMLSVCPEAKRLFTALHERTCSIKMECPKNMTLNFFEWQEEQKKEGFDNCKEACSIDHHPMAKQAQNWG